MERRYYAAALSIALFAGLGISQLNVLGGQTSDKCFMNASGFEGSALVLENYTKDNNSIELSFRNDGLNSVFVHNVSLSNSENQSVKEVDTTVDLSDKFSVDFEVSEGDCTDLDSTVFYDVPRANLENQSLAGSVRGEFSLG